MANTRKVNGTRPEFDWDALLVEPKRATADVSVCLRADLLREHAAAEAELAAVQTKTVDDRLGSVPARKVLAEKVRAIEEQMQAATQSIELQAMRPPDFRALRGKYPPRKGNETDRGYGTNTDTVWPELLAETATVPKRDADYWRAFLEDGRLNNGQAEQVMVAAWMVNAQAVATPFSKLASLLTRSSGEQSKPPTG